MKIKIQQKQEYRNAPVEGVPDTLWSKIQGKHAWEQRLFYFVFLHVELTNEEKAIIQQYRLSELVVDETPNPRLAQIAQEYEASNSRSERERLARDMKLCQEVGPLQYKLADFISENGFTRGNDTLREASDYAQKLKTQILPKIKQTIEHYSATGGTSSDTFEL
jgi:hypothetical protein